MTLIKFDTTAASRDTVCVYANILQFLFFNNNELGTENKR